MQAQEKTYEKFWWLIAIAAGGLFAIWIHANGWNWEGYPCYVWSASAAVRIGYFLIFFFVLMGFVYLLYETAVGRARFTLQTIILSMIIFILLRIITGSALPLLGDEAYHWLWPGRLDWAYYDHPGLLAWMAWPFKMISGTVVSSRMLPICLGSMTAILLWYFSKSLSHDKQFADQVYAGLMLLPLAFVGTIILFTDAPLGFLWPAALWITLTAVRKQTIGWWVLLGVVLGISMNCKFLTFVLVGMLGLHLLIDPMGRRSFLTIGPYLAIAITIVFCFPFMYWNYTHNWQTFVFNFVTRPKYMQFAPEGLWIFAAQELLLMGPILLVWSIFMPAYWGGKKLWEGHFPAVSLVLVSYFPFMLYTLMKPFSTAGAGWTAPFISLFVIILVWSVKDGIINRKWLNYSLRTGGITTCLLVFGFIGQFFAGPDVMHSLIRPFASEKRMEHYLIWYFVWYPLGQELDELYEKENAKHPTFLMARTYMQAAQMTQYTRKPNLVLSYGYDSMYGRCFDYWNEEETHPGMNGVFIANHELRHTHTDELKRSFESVREIPFSERKPRHWVANYFRLYRGESMKTFPKAELGK